jgi:hypothetical protein
MAPRGARYTTAPRGAMPLRVASTDGLGHTIEPRSKLLVVSNAQRF